VLHRKSQRFAGSARSSQKCDRTRQDFTSKFCIELTSWNSLESRFSGQAFSETTFGSRCRGIEEKPGIDCVVSVAPLGCVSILHHRLHSVALIRP
jgi:hypothetical protein